MCSYAQDRIKTKSGNSYECFITTIDSSIVRFCIESKDKEVSTHILTDSVSNINYNGKMYNLKKLSSEEINNIQKEFNFDHNSEAFRLNNSQWPHDYAYTFDGEVFSGRQVEYKNNSFYPDKLKVDKVPIPIGIVAFFNNKDGFYANIKKQNTYGKGKFIRRISYGKINLYEDA
jgi:hypothetical protein